MANTRREARRTVSQHLGYIVAALIGWKVSIEEPIPSKCVIIGAHHTTTAWDMILTLILRMATGLPFQFVFKSSNNVGIRGRMMREIGGVPVDRQNSQGFVSQMVNAFDKYDPFIIAILPEGSRSKMPFWRTSFYYIALEAGVPIVLGYGDYRRKVVGLGPVITPTGDIEADFEHFARFYAGVTAKNPHKQGQVRLKPKENQQDETE